MYRLIYKSRVTRELDWPVIEEILHHSAANNSLAEVTGFLLATRSHFLQVIEGRFEDVNETFFRIVRDTRHERIQLLSYEVVDARLFESWAMKGIGILDANTDLARQLIAKYGEQDGGVRFPLEAWLALSMIYDIRAIQELPEWKR
ncbi:MAG: BLUF domain-containing protein [Azonexus sp.]